MAIRESIVLEGDDVVIQKLQNISKEGEASLKSFRDLGKGDGGNPFQSLIDNAKKAGLEIQQTSGHSTKFKDVLHALRPVLQAAGIQFSELGGLARLASTSLVGLAAATVGSVVVGLAKLEENAARAKGELSDLFGGSAQGQKAFDALDHEASQFGTTVDNLVPGIESLKKALDAVSNTKGFVALKVEDLPIATVSLDRVTAAYSNFVKILRAGQLTQDQAEKSAKAFFDTFKDGGPVTVAALQALPVGSLKLLQEALGRGGQTAKNFFDEVRNGTIGINQVNAALANFGPQIQVAFDTKAIHTFSDEIGRLLSTLNKGFADLGGKPFSDFVIGELKRIREGIEATITDLKRLREFDTATGSSAFGKFTSVFVKAFQNVISGPALRDAFGGTTEEINKIWEGAGQSAADAFQKSFIPGSVDAANSIQKLGAAGATAGQVATKAIDTISASLQTMRDQAKVTGQELQDVIVGSTRFTGRLNQIRVFQPQLAGEFDPVADATKKADEAAKAVQKAFIDNPFFKQGVGVPVTPVVLMNKFQEQLGFMQRIAENTPIPIIIDFAGIFSKFQQLYQSVVAIFATPISVLFQWQNNPFLAQQPTNLAIGGRVRGPGSTTSDSILAFLSNREFVINARAVDFYGSSLFAALNSMRLPRSLIGAVPRFAEGGQATTTGSSLTLVLGGRQFEARASEGTVTALRRFAINSQLASIGRKPGFVR